MMYPKHLKSEQLKKIPVLFALILLSLSSAAQLIIILDSEQNGDDVKTDFLATNFEDILSMQFTIRWNPDHLEFQDIDGLGLNGMTFSNFGTQNASEGLLTMSWFDPDVEGITLVDGSSIFNLNFKSLSPDAPYIEIVGWPTDIEIFDADENPVTLITNNSTNNLGQIKGNVFYDLNENCVFDTGEPALNDWTIHSAGVYDFYSSSNHEGDYSLFNNPGITLLSLIPPNDLWETCDNNISVNVIDAGIQIVDFPVKPKVACSYLEVDISTSRLRRCLDNTYVVNFCNKGTVLADGAYIEIEFDPFFEINGSSLPWTTVDGNLYTFPIGDIAIGECGSFTVDFTLNCDAVLGQSHCVSAQIFPNDPCIAPSPSWDGSSLEVNAECNGDSLLFHIKNQGADMGSPLEFIVIEDVMINMTSQDAAPILLASQQTHTLSFEANGSTFRMEVEQVPNHPGNSHPAATVEGCGVNGGGTFSLGFVPQFAQDDADYFLDRDCQENVGSYDPNDKRGFPKGFCDNHIIHPNTDLEYQIRFQNTGTDTAFNVIIKDTLSQHLDLTTLRPGASSHSYDFELLGQGVVQFTFQDILLPDSNVNEAASHGFVKFKIAQRADLPFGTILENEAAIYFDFNEPIITNQVFHTIGEGYVGEPNGNISISGTITKPDDTPVDSVFVFTSDNCPVYTNEDGFYNIIGLDTAQNLTIAPSKDEVPLECITILDLVKLRNFILGFTTFDHPYQQIVADVNNSSSITTFDLVEMRQFTLGVTDEFSNNTAWRFVEKDAFWTLPPINWPSILDINNLTQDLVYDWVAVATGDIISESMVPTLDVQPEFSVMDVVACSEQISVGITVSEFEEVNGFQFSVTWDPAVLEFQLLENQLGLPDYTYWYRPEPGILNLSVLFPDTINIGDGTMILRLHFDPIGGSGTSTEISLNQESMPFQVITSECALTEPIFHSGSVFILDAQGFEVSSQSSNPLCAGIADGNINLSVSGGTPPYVFEWSTSENTQDIFGLTAGFYNCTISDVNGCQLLESFELTEPAPIAIEDFGIVNATGAMESDGAIFINEVSGGTPPYTYAWPNGANTSFVANVLPGNYEVTIADANGCEFLEIFEIGFTTGNTSLEKDGVRIILHPNPVERHQFAQLSFEVGEAQDLNIKILEPTGKTLFQELVNFKAGNSKYLLQTNFSKGLYFVEISNNEVARKILKLIIQ